MFESLVGLSSTCLGGIFIMSLLSGSSLPVECLNPSWALVYLFGGHFHNESSFWVRSSCWVFESLVGLSSTCLGGIFIMSLLSGSSLPVECLNPSWALVYLFGGHFHNESSF